MLLTVASASLGFAWVYVQVAQSMASRWTDVDLRTRVVQAKITQNLTDFKVALSQTSSVAPAILFDLASTASSVAEYREITKSLISGSEDQRDLRDLVAGLEQVRANILQIETLIAQHADITATLTDIQKNCKELLPTAPTWRTRQSILSALQISEKNLLRWREQSPSSLVNLTWDSLDELSRELRRYSADFNNVRDGVSSDRIECPSLAALQRIDQIAEDLNSIDSIRRAILNNEIFNFNISSSPQSDWKDQWRELLPLVFMIFITLLGIVFVTAYFQRLASKFRAQEEKYSVTAADLKMKNDSLAEFTSKIIRESRGSAVSSWSAAKDLVSELEMPEEAVWAIKSREGLARIFANYHEAQEMTREYLRRLNSDFHSGADDARLERRLAELIEYFSALERDAQALEQAVSLHLEASNAASDAVKACQSEWFERLQQLTKALLNDVQRLGRELSHLDARKSKIHD